jgi:hypothetical protein
MALGSRDRCILTSRPEKSCSWRAWTDILVEASSINSNHNPCVRQQDLIPLKMADVFIPTTESDAVCKILLYTHFEFAICKFAPGYSQQRHSHFYDTQ